MKYYELLKQGENVLEESGISEAAVDAWILFESAFGMNQSQYFLKKMDEVPEDEARKSQIALFRKYIEERCTHRPVQYITGRWNFMGMELEVNEHVLIPRFDTECLVEKAIQVIHCIRQSKQPDTSVKVLDMCTGSGCIAISIKKLCDRKKDIPNQCEYNNDSKLKNHSHKEEKLDFGDLYVEAADISQKALEVAMRNAGQQNVDIRFVQSDLFQNMDSGRKFDIIISNPPYIKTEEIASLMPEVRSFEPMIALDGDVDGLKFYRKIIDEGREFIQDGGFLLFEIGCHQGRAVKELLERCGYHGIEIIRDLAGLDRVVAARFKYNEKSRGAE